jgi:biotin transporter BioY
VAIGFVNFSSGFVFSYLLVPFILMGSFYPSVPNEKFSSRFFGIASCGTSLIYLLAFVYAVGQYEDIFSNLVSNFDVLSFGIHCVFLPSFSVCCRLNFQTMYGAIKSKQ